MEWRSKAKVREAYDALAAHYDEAYTSPPDLAENDLIGRRVRDLDGRGNILDLGCGTGLLLELHPCKTSGYIGLDISGGMLERARAKFPGHLFCQSDMEEPWPVEPGSVDTVVSLFSWNYSTAPACTVRNLATALRPYSGRFMIVLYGMRWPTRHSYVQGHDGEPILYSAESARALFDTGDFDEVSVRGLSRFVDVFRRAPVPLARGVLALEVATILRAFPDQGYFLIVEGRRTGYS